MSRPNDAWMGHFVDVRPISANGAFRMAACRDARTGRRVVVVTGDRDVDTEAAGTALERLYWAHSTIAHLAIAPAVEFAASSSHEPHVVLDVPAQLDLETLLGLAQRSSFHRVEHGQGDAFVFYLREGLSEAARHVDPEDGGPVCIGALGQSNVLFARDGRYWLVGLGHNVALCDEHGRFGARNAFAAPEVFLGERPSPMGDYIAIMKFARSLMGFMSLSPPLAHLVKGQGLGQHLELLKLILWCETRVLGAPLHQRASVEEAVDVAWRIREILGTELDLEGFRATAARVIEEEGEFDGDDEVWGDWWIAPDGSWVARAGVRRELRSKPMRLILRALLEARETRPGAMLRVEELLSAGWPGERVRRRAGQNRVYVAVNGLRRSGLGADLESQDGGYRLSPAVRWVRAAAPTGPGAEAAPRSLQQV
ncbi:MAG: hypothetical protein MJE66_18265 [Proteobacteria bacterium]|nr:hypothetical protein [Pseudomonadota bacterium]